MSESKSDALTSLATPLHRCPARAVHLELELPSAARGPGGERMAPQRAAHPARPARGPIARHRCRWRRAASRPCEDRASRTRHAAVAEGSRESGRRAFDIGAKTLGSGLEVVRPEAFGKSRPGFPRRSRLGIDARNCLGKARDSSSGDALGDLRPGEDLARGQRCRGLDDGEPRRLEVDRDEPLADAAGQRVGSGRGRTARRRRAPGRAAAAARAASRGARAGSGPAASTPRRSCRRRGRRPTGTRLSSVMSAPSVVADAACRARAARRHRSSAGSAAPSVVAAQQAVGARLDMERVAPVDQHHQRFEQVQAVGAAADDVQEEVELGRRRHVVDRRDRHRVTTGRGGFAP